MFSPCQKHTAKKSRRSIPSKNKKLSSFLQNKTQSTTRILMGLVCLTGRLELNRFPSLQNLSPNGNIHCLIFLLVS